MRAAVESADAHLQCKGRSWVISRINSAAAESRHAFCCSLVRYCSGFLLPRGTSLWHLRCHFCASHERTSVNPGCIPYLRVVGCFRVVDCLRDVFLRIRHHPFSWHLLSINARHQTCFVEHLAGFF